jgi:hypothetical protein
MGAFSSIFGTDSMSEEASGQRRDQTPDSNISNRSNKCPISEPAKMNLEVCQSAAASRSLKRFGEVPGAPGWLADVCSVAQLIYASTTSPHLQ